jgi:polysaccharide pyruvyl transferase WcaK-like protein
MIIGLMGFEFSSPNKGCEALGYSFLSILSEILESATIYNFDPGSLETLKTMFPKFSFISVPFKLKDFSFIALKTLKKCDFIFDITMGDSFTDMYSLKYFKSLLLRKKIAQFFNSNYYLLPQTYGPFSSEKSKKLALQVIKKAKKVYCRDDLSKKLVEDVVPKDKLFLTSDLAFKLKYDGLAYPLKKNNNTHIGINISGLLFKGGFNSLNQFDLKIEYPNFINLLLNYYCNKSEYEVHLIPHVIDLGINSYDDDYKVCQMLKKTYPKLILPEPFVTPIQAKSYISNMDFFIGSRMHSTVAAFSSMVPTVPVSYSRKFEGLYRSIGYEYLINGKIETNESALNKIIYYEKNKDMLLSSQIKSLKIIKSSLIDFTEDLKFNLIGVKNVR